MSNIPPFDPDITVSRRESVVTLLTGISGLDRTYIEDRIKDAYLKQCQRVFETKGFDKAPEDFIAWLAERTVWNAVVRKYMPGRNYPWPFKNPPQILEANMDSSVAYETYVSSQRAMAANQSSIDAEEKGTRPATQPPPEQPAVSSKEDNSKEKAAQPQPGPYTVASKSPVAAPVEAPSTVKDIRLQMMEMIIDITEKVDRLEARLSGPNTSPLPDPRKRRRLE
ncbi:hypothetical protein ONZ43_g1103 [Nemania bipapillata]|uniref:Uncharacterized protein n=1 Tax=Nemania bipapillata TaxID=110536 RepID=A0ACC2J5T0_9PEZI|nr:hypothetical protein ONZ43_g1103 [Nemania bipapillata]